MRKRNMFKAPDAINVWVTYGVSRWKGAQAAALNVHSLSPFPIQMTIGDIKLAGKRITVHAPHGAIVNAIGSREYSGNSAMASVYRVAAGWAGQLQPHVWAGAPKIKKIETQPVWVSKGRISVTESVEGYESTACGHWLVLKTSGKESIRARFNGSEVWVEGKDLTIQAPEGTRIMAYLKTLNGEIIMHITRYSDGYGWSGSNLSSKW